jgi:hypothetical protein
MSASDFSTVISNIVADDMMLHFKDLMKRILFSFTTELSKTHKISVEEVVLIWNKALPHLAYEIHIPNKNKVKTSDKDEHKEHKEHKEVEDEKECNCQFILTRGKNKGESCGKKTVKGSNFCTTHNKKAPVEKEKEEDEKDEQLIEQETPSGSIEEKKVSDKEHTSEEVCKYVLTRGKNKGEKCKKKVVKNGHYCVTHNKENNEEQVEKSDEKVVEKKQEEKEEQEEKKKEHVKKSDEKKDEKVVEKKQEEKEEQEEKKKEHVKKSDEKKDEKVVEKKEKDLKTKVDALETKLKIAEMKKQEDSKLKSIQTEKNNIGQDMAKKLLDQVKNTTEKQNDEDDNLTYEKIKKQMFISCKLNDDNELECKVSKANLEKLINSKISSDEEFFDTTINIFPKGMNIFYNENNDKVQKKILKLRFKNFHSVIYDYLDE